MRSVVARKLLLESIGTGIPVIPPDAAGFYRQNCMVCFHHHGHRSGVLMRVHYREEIEAFEVAWDGEVSEQIVRSYGDKRRAVDNAACAIALLLVREMTDFTGIEQSSTGSTIDYYLVPQGQDDTLIFNRAARLEVSGILRETEDNTVEDRVRSKLRRLKPEGGLPDFIVIVEFSKPWSKMVSA